MSDDISITLGLIYGSMSCIFIDDNKRLSYNIRVLDNHFSQNYHKKSHFIMESTLKAFHFKHFLT
jgi:hypothetical protein